MPPNSTLKAELYVPTRAVGFVRAGQPVRVLYDAFPYQSFGTYGGRIETVSQTILTASDVSGPISLSEPAYRVTARLDRPDVDAYGRRVPLQPGMLLKADIILEKRSLLKWLLDPLLSART
jgi:membrane fusion protein